MIHSQMSLSSGFFAWSNTCCVYSLTPASHIEAGKRFCWDPITEDLDLSYLSFMAGYRFVYVPDAPQMLESPPNILAHKQQVCALFVMLDMMFAKHSYTPLMFT